MSSKEPTNTPTPNPESPVPPVPPPNVVLSIWPQPQNVSQGSEVISIVHPITIKSNSNSQVLLEAINRYKPYIFPCSNNVTDFFVYSGLNDPLQIPSSSTPSSNIYIHIQTADESLHLLTNESYSLNVNSSGVEIRSQTVFGALRGLETLSQIVKMKGENNELLMKKISNFQKIPLDYPRFPYRGVLVDTSRHFIPMPALKKVMLGMSFTKLNVFHWHITDSQSFPIQSVNVPELTKGAYSSREIYSTDDVKSIIAYGKSLGIRVIPEFDVPGHTASWSSIPNITVCVNAQPWREYGASPPAGQLNPVSEKTYEVLNNFLTEMGELFPDNVLHLGHDEVNEKCWIGAKSIQDNLPSGVALNIKSLTEYFLNRVVNTIIKPQNKTLMIWEEPFTHLNINTSIYPASTIIQLWRQGDSTTIQSVLNSGLNVVVSNYKAWYLDCGFGSFLTGGGNSWCDPYKTPQTVYSYDPSDSIPASFLLNPLSPPADGSEISAKLLGGEVCSWSEITDATNVETKIFPRAAALGERLWSTVGKEGQWQWENVVRRLNLWRQRVLVRGIKAVPVQPKW
ncbi:glycoside hydrolase superfamily [Paraphysoderma sedebokerense]|nr:glycoside hydrolase superfamily [Paraphysoderma sedebokerense]